MLLLNDFQNTIQGWWDGLTAATADTAEWFQQIGYAVGSAVGSVLYNIIKEPMGLIAAVCDLVQKIIALIAYLFAPLWYIAKFIAGFFAAATMYPAVVATNNAFANNAINNFIIAFPGYTLMMTVLNAALWVMLGFHIMNSLKKI